jgi:hypothetical protein
MGCYPKDNHFSLALKHFLINLRLVPGNSKTRPSGSNSWNRFFFHFAKIYRSHFKIFNIILSIHLIKDIFPQKAQKIQKCLSRNEIFCSMSSLRPVGPTPRRGMRENSPQAYKLIFRGLIFEHNEEIGQNSHLWRHYTR